MRVPATLLLCAAFVAGQDDDKYSSIGGALQQPPVIESSAGLLQHTLVVDQFRYNGPVNQFWTRAYDSGISGPTWVVQPGDTITMTVENRMGPNPVGEETTINTYHSPNSTNIHTHGLHISGEAPGDDIFTLIEPGDSHEYTYVIPADHAGGTFWYHAHKHSSTSLQVGGGAAGMIIVRDEAGDVPLQIADMEDIVMMAHSFKMAGGASLLNIAQTMEDNLLTQFDGPTSDFVLINGMYQPVVPLTTGKWVRLRFVHSGTTGILQLTLPGCEIQLLAKDGIYLPTAPRTVTDIYLVVGARADVAVRCSLAGTYTMGSDGAGRGAGAPFVQATVVTFTVVDNGAADPVLSPFQAVKPDYLADLQDSLPTTEFTLAIGGGGGGCTMNGLAFSGPTDYITEQPIGGVNQWTISGIAGHPFHLHVNPFQVISVTDSTGHTQVGDWHDVLYLPAGGPNVIIRFQTDRFTGHSVMHCHFLPHEDLGCMAVMNVVGVEGTPGPVQSEVTAPFINAHLPAAAARVARPQQTLGVCGQPGLGQRDDVLFSLTFPTMAQPQFNNLRAQYVEAVAAAAGTSTRRVTILEVQATAGVQVQTRVRFEVGPSDNGGESFLCLLLSNPIAVVAARPALTQFGIPVPSAVSIRTFITPF